MTERSFSSEPIEHSLKELPALRERLRQLAERLAELEKELRRTDPTNEYFVRYPLSYT